MVLAPDRAGPSAAALDAAGLREIVRGTVLERVGDTPLVPLRRIGTTAGEVWAKLEGRNPGGSVKDRAALWMVLEAEGRRELDGSRRILEATSGNMGVALALVGAVRRHAVTLCMPDRVSLERRRMAAAFGAEIVLTDPLEGTDGAILEARRRADADRTRYVYLDQYSNPANPAAHEATTGPEIWAQSAGRVTHVVAGVGTSGTVLGTGRALRPLGVKLVGVQPDEALHGLEGLKHMASVMRPAIWDESGVDEHATVATAEGLAMARRLAREEGIFCGPSGGAAVVAALRVADRDGGVVVAVLPDGGERYLSTPMWE